MAPRKEKMGVVVTVGACIYIHAATVGKAVLLEVGHWMEVVVVLLEMAADSYSPEEGMVEGRGGSSPNYLLQFGVSPEILGGSLDAVHKIHFRG